MLGCPMVPADLQYRSSKYTSKSGVQNIFNGDRVREDLLATRKVCRQYGCPLEFILKDISTVRYELQRLFEWAAIAMEVACEG